MKLKEMFDSALPIITKFSPSIGAAIGGPYGFAAGYILPILASSFGSHPSNIQDLVSRIISDPQADVKLASLEHEHGDWLCGIFDSASKLQEAEINVKLKWANQD
jgi:hypothetical protein